MTELSAGTVAWCSEELGASFPRPKLSAQVASDSRCRPRPAGNGGDSRTGD